MELITKMHTHISSILNDLILPRKSLLLSPLFCSNSYCCLNLSLAAASFNYFTFSNSSIFLFKSSIFDYWFAYLSFSSSCNILNLIYLNMASLLSTSGLSCMLSSSQPKLSPAAAWSLRNYFCYTFLSNYRSSLCRSPGL